MWPMGLLFFFRGYFIIYGESETGCKYGRKHWSKHCLQVSPQQALKYFLTLKQYNIDPTFNISISQPWEDCVTLTGKIGNLWFLSITVKTIDCTMQCAETNLLRTSSKTLDWNSYFKLIFYPFTFTPIIYNLLLYYYIY